MTTPELATAPLAAVVDAFLAEEFQPTRPAKAELARRGGAEVATLLASRLPGWAGAHRVAACHALELLRQFADPIVLDALVALAAATAPDRPDGDPLVFRDAVAALAALDDARALAWVRTALHDRAWPLDRGARERLVAPIIATLVTRAPPAATFAILAPIVQDARARGAYDPVVATALQALASPGARLDPGWFEVATAALASGDAAPGSIEATACQAIAASAPTPARRGYVLALHAAGRLTEPVWLGALDPADPDEAAALRAYLAQPPPLAAAACAQLARDPAARPAMLDELTRRIAAAAAELDVAGVPWIRAGVGIGDPALALPLWRAEQAVQAARATTAPARQARATLLAQLEWVRGQVAPDFTPPRDVRATAKAGRGPATLGPRAVGGARPARARSSNAAAVRGDAAGAAFPFLFFGADPGDWIEGANAGHVYQLCFQGRLGAAAIARVAAALAAAPLTHAELATGGWLWGALDGDTWAELAIGGDRPFAAFARWLGEVHARVPLREVVFVGARAEGATDAWTAWSYAQTAGPRRAPDFGAGHAYDACLHRAERVPVRGRRDARFDAALARLGA